MARWRGDRKDISKTRLLSFYLNPWMFCSIQSKYWIFRRRLHKAHLLHASILYLWKNAKVKPRNMDPTGTLLHPAGLMQLVSFLWKNDKQNQCPGNVLRQNKLQGWQIPWVQGSPEAAQCWRQDWCSGKEVLSLQEPQPGRQVLSTPASEATAFIGCCCVLSCIVYKWCLLIKCGDWFGGREEGSQQE